MAKLVKNKKSGEFEIVDVWSDLDIITVVTNNEDCEIPPTIEEIRLLMETIVKNYDCNNGVNNEIIYATWCDLKKENK